MNIKLPRARRRALPLLALAITLVAAAGCQTARRAPDPGGGTLLGRVEATAGRHAVVVAKDERGRVVHRAFLADKRTYEIAVPAGKLSVYAFIDENGDGWLGANEPASARLVLAAPLSRHDRIELPRLDVRQSRGVVAAN